MRAWSDRPGRIQEAEFAARCAEMRETAQAIQERLEELRRRNRQILAESQRLRAAIIAERNFRNGDPSGSTVQ